MYEGQLDGEPVVVKTVRQLLKNAEHGDNAVRIFFDECERLKGLDHPHVIGEYQAHDSLGHDLLWVGYTANER